MVMMVTFSSSLAASLSITSADMFEEIAQRLVFLHRAGKFDEIVRAAGAFGRAIGVQHIVIAAFGHHHADQF